MVRADQLTKHFCHKAALSNLTLHVTTGEIFGLLGHNGAGKSTTFGLLLGQLHPDSGEAFIRGISVQQDRRRALESVGAVPERPAFYDYLSGWQNLVVVSSLSGRIPKSEIEAVVNLVGLNARIGDRVSTYSRGMRQRLALAQALLPRPKLLVLDEPMEGLDPGGLVEMRDLVRNLARDYGMTIIFASHRLSDVEQLCDRVAILHAGELIFIGPWPGDEPTYFRLSVDDWPNTTKIVERLGVQIVGPGTVSFRPGTDSAALISALVTEGVRVHSAAPVPRTLEEFYFRKLPRS